MSTFFDDIEHDIISDNLISDNVSKTLYGPTDFKECNTLNDYIKFIIKYTNIEYIFDTINNITKLVSNWGMTEYEYDNICFMVINHLNAILDKDKLETDLYHTNVHKFSNNIEFNPIIGQYQPHIHVSICLNNVKDGQPFFYLSISLHGMRCHMKEFKITNINDLNYINYDEIKEFKTKFYS